MNAVIDTDMLVPVIGKPSLGFPTCYAGFWRRAMAFAIDVSLVLAIMVGISIAQGVSIAQVNDTVMIQKDGRSRPISEFAKPQVVVTRDGPQTTTVETTTATIGFQTVHIVVTRTSVEQKGGGKPRTSTQSNLTMLPSPMALGAFFVIWSLLASLLESSRLRGSIGKLVMFIRVADEQGRRVSLPRALARNALKPLSVLPLCGGCLMAGWTAKKQALHDILAKCTVDVAVG